MTSRTLNRLMIFNEDNQLDEEEQKRNLNLAFESYGKARQLREESKNIENLHYSMDDGFVNGRQKELYARRMAELRRDGWWSPDNPDDLRWFDTQTTLERTKQAALKGILVKCTVEWST